MRLTNQIDTLQTELAHLEEFDASAKELANQHFALGVAHLRLQENEVAIKHLQKCVMLDSTNAIAHAYLGAALVEEYQVDAARDHLLEAIELAPDEMLVHLKMGEFQYRLGIYSEALAQFEQAARLQSPNLVTAQYLTTMLEKTRKHMRNSVARDPKVISFKGVGNFLGRFKKADKAETTSSESDQVAPDQETN